MRISIPVTSLREGMTVLEKGGKDKTFLKERFTTTGRIQEDMSFKTGRGYLVTWRRCDTAMVEVDLPGTLLTRLLLQGDWP